jgi:multidrug efflux pump subunit AcrB
MSDPNQPRPAVTLDSAPWYSLFFRNRHLLILSIMVLLVAGFSAIKNVPRLEDPRIDTRNVLVITPYPGASAERVEALVTDVIEDELRQLFEIKDMDSTSRAGISIVSIELQAWVDNNSNKQIFSKIRDGLGNAQQRFPQGAGVPFLDERRSATAFTLLVGITAPAGHEAPLAIMSRMSQHLSDQLRNVQGTELVRIYGDLEEEIEVLIDPQQLSAAGFSIDQASALIASADPKQPAGTLYSEYHNTRLQVAQPLASVSMISELPMGVSAQGAYLRLGDIAQVKRGWSTQVNDIAMVDGEQVIFVAARMETSLRVDIWTDNALQVIEDFNRQFGSTVQAKVVFEQNIYTEARLSELTQNLILGCLVVMAVVLVFMGIKASWIVGLSLPLCAAFAIFSLSFFDEQIHQMSIFGIIIAIGLLIDNAIVITDEIRGKLLDAGTSRIEALVQSIRHLFVPLLASTLTTILGFMPIFLLPGNIGDFIGSIAISVVMALIGSLFISLSIIAALAARFLPRGKNLQGTWLSRGIQMPTISNGYRNALEAGLKRPLLGISVSIALALSGFVLAGQLGNVFFPSADRDQFEIYLWMPEGTNIEKTQELVKEVDEFIRLKPSVKQLNWLIGGSFPAVYYNQVMNKDNSSHYANGVVTTYSINDAKDVITHLQQELEEKYTQVKVVVRVFGQGPPVSAPVGFKIFGPDINILNRLGEQVRLAMSQVPGISQSLASISLGEPEWVLSASQNVALLSGLSLTEMATQLQFSLEGKVGGSILEGTEEIPIRIRVGDQQRGGLSQIQALPITSQKLREQGLWTSVSALGDFSLTPTVAGITRDNGRRVNNVEAFLLPNATAIDVSAQVQQKLKDMNFILPKGYHFKVAGDADEQQQALGQLATYAPVLLVLMITTLILSFASVRLALVIGAVAVLSVGFGMLSLWISGLPLGFNPLLGCAGLIGVAINGSIVVIAAINANPLAKAGNIQQIVQETMGCSRHILSTTFTTIGGFIPLLLFSEGSFWPPLAVVLAGGVGFSVVLSLVFTPLVVSKLALVKKPEAEILAELS